MVEHSVVTRAIRVRTPSVPPNSKAEAYYRRIPQWLEDLSYKQAVDGSNPSSPTKQ